MRIVFVTDLHGSTLLFEKALRAVIHYDADLFLLGGDLSGKRLLPIVSGRDGAFIVQEPYRAKDDAGTMTEIAQRELVGKAGLHAALRRFEAKGYYWHIGDEDVLRQLNDSTAQLRVIFDQEITTRLARWAEMAESSLPDGVQCVWTGGNDDSEGVLQAVAKLGAEKFRYGEDLVLEIDSYEIASLGVSNPTPFNTDREMPEAEVGQRLQRLAKSARSAETLILNVHVPPVNCGTLDLCMDPVQRGRFVHVGSVAVREFIEDMQPVADFAGHIHEGKGTARIGRTEIFNPGSDCTAGVLQGFVVDFRGASIVDYLHFCD